MRQFHRAFVSRCSSVLLPYLIGGWVMMSGISLNHGLASETPVAPVRKVDLPNGLPLTQYLLSNGLNLYVIENHSAPVFTYQTWFAVGSKDEKLDSQIQSTGLAHLFEHMMFRGTKNTPDGQFDTILARNGVHDQNATTWVDRTNYYESLPKDRLEIVMQLESDRMSNLLIDDKLLATEKDVVLGEYHMGLDDPDTVSQDQLYAAAYTVHPYKYSTIGTDTEIKSFTVDQANYFYKKYYSPSNATLILVGDLDPAAVVDMAKKYYGSIVAQTVDQLLAPVEPVQTAEKRVDFKHPQLQNQKVLLGHHVPGVADADFPALWVLTSALTYGQSALLELNWVNAGIAISVQGDINHFKDPGLLVISADLQPSATAEGAEAVLDRVLADLVASGGRDVLERARNQLLLSIYSQSEENSGLASFLGEYAITAGDPIFGFDLISKIQAVQPADLVRVASYLQASNRTVVVGSPE